MSLPGGVPLNLVLIACLVVIMVGLARAGHYFLTSGASVGARVAIGAGLFGLMLVAAYVGFITQQIAT